MKNYTQALFILLSFVFTGYAQNNSVTEDATNTKIMLVRHSEKADDGTKNPTLSS